MRLNVVEIISPAISVMVVHLTAIEDIENAITIHDKNWRKSEIDRSEEMLPS